MDDQGRTIAPRVCREFAPLGEAEQANVQPQTSKPLRLPKISRVSNTLGLVIVIVLILIINCV